MNKNRVSLFVLISLIILGFFGWLFVGRTSQSDLELTEVNLLATMSGTMEEEVTFLSVMNQTSAVVVGHVTGTKKLDDTRNLFTVGVQDRIAGEIDAESILVYIDEERIELNETYLLFLDPFESTLYDDYFYTQHPEFVIKVDADHELYRLENAFEKTYVRPFIEEEYNTVEGLRRQIADKE